MASQNYPFPNSFPTFYTDLGVNAQNPGLGYGGTETGALYFEDREVNGAMYRVQNATWNKVAQKWLPVDSTKPVYGSVLLSNGTTQFITQAAGVSPFTSFTVVASIDKNGNVTGNLSGSVSGGSFTGTSGTFSGAVTAASFSGPLSGNVTGSLSNGSLSSLTGLAVPANADLSAIGLFNVKFYGAKGDGTTDDTAAIQSAITAAQSAKGNVWIPTATYKTTSSLNISGTVALIGVEAGPQSGTTLLSSGNYPTLNITGSCTVEGITFQGTGTVANTAENAAYVNAANNVVLRKCTFLNSYDAVVYNNVCFYARIVDCTFLSAVNSFVRTQGTGASGVDLTIGGCTKFLTSLTTGGSSQYPAYGMLFDNLGSLLCDNLQFSPALCTVAGVKFNTIASSYGDARFTNCILEGAASGAYGVWLAGTAGTPIKFVFFTNCNIGCAGSGATNYSVRMDYANKIFFTECLLSCAGRLVLFNNSVTNVSMANCSYECNDVCLAATGTITTLSNLSISSPQYNGTQIFAYFANLSNSQLSAMSIVGGNIGTNATPFLGPANAKSYIRVPTTTNGNLTGEAFGVGTFSGTGAQTVFNIAHGLSMAPTSWCVTASSGGATSSVFYVTATATNLVVTFNTAPASGTNNVVLTWTASFS